MLYVVPTPLGNLEDITLRARRVLGEVRAVYCEDTRRTRALLSHLGIQTRTLRYDERDPRALDEILGRLERGEDLALVSDGGTPVISDPGLALVARARASGLPVSALPGPCAAASAVAGSGLPGDSFVFLGFLSRSPGRRGRALREAAALGRTIVLYEAPGRVLRLLEELESALGPETRVSLARELSKKHEEWIAGTPAAAAQALRARPELLGEFVVVARAPDARVRENDQDDTGG